MAAKDAIRAITKALENYQREKLGVRRIDVYWDSAGLYNSKSGIYHYALNLYLELSRLGVSPRVFSPSSMSKEIAHQFPFENKAVGSAWNILAKTGLQPSFSEFLMLQDPKMRTVIFHGLSNYNLGLPILKSGKRIRRVLTVHDLIPLIGGGVVSRAQQMKFEFFLPRALKAADAVIVVSSWTKGELLSKYPWVEAKTVLIRNGVQKIDPTSAPRRQHGIPTALYVARGESYKRTEWFCEIIRQSTEKLRGILVTDQTTGERLAHQFQDLKEKGSLQIDINLSDHSLMARFQEAQIYVHPSLYEGFNIPVSTALCMGLPVVCCSGSGTSELLGPKIAIELDSSAGIQDWLYAIGHQMEQSSSPEWYTIVEEHIAKLGSWKDCALAVKSVYERLA